MDREYFDSHHDHYGMDTKYGTGRRIEDITDSMGRKNIILVLVNNLLINGAAGIQAALFYDITLGIVHNEKLIQKIKQIYKQYVLKDVENFHLYDYQKFEEEIWSLKEEFNLQNSPFLLLPEPAEAADYDMMNATNDGFTEPDNLAKEVYIEKMRISYNRFVELHNNQFS